MYRKASGHLGFHPFQIFNDLPGSLSSSSATDPGHMSMTHGESVYLYQLSCPNPWAMNEGTLFVCKIADNDTMSRKLFHHLQKLNLVTASGEVDTAGFDDPSFGKHFTNALSLIPISRQRQVVDFLFWWDEEAQRLKKLMAERTDLMAQKAKATDAAERDRFQLLLNRIQLKIGAWPGARNVRMEQDEDLADIEATTMGTAPQVDTGEGLPAYRH